MEGRHGENANIRVPQRPLERRIPARDRFAPDSLLEEAVMSELGFHANARPAGTTAGLASGAETPFGGRDACALDWDQLASERGAGNRPSSCQSGRNPARSLISNNRGIGMGLKGTRAKMQL
jgi:hypothetical protein